MYGSKMGFHAVDVDTATVYDLYIPQHVSAHLLLLLLLRVYFI